MNNFAAFLSGTLNYLVRNMGYRMKLRARQIKKNKRGKNEPFLW